MLTRQTLYFHTYSGSELVSHDRLVRRDSRKSDVLLSYGGITVLFFDAYLDESGCDDQSKILVVGGYLVERGQARIMERRWNALLRQYDIPFFHMVDCAHGNEQFKHMPKEKRARLAQKLIELIGSRQAWGFAVACPSGRHFPIKGQDPYTSCVGQCAILLQTILKTELSGESVSIFIEAGHKSASAAKSVLDCLVQSPDLDKISSYSFARKDQSVLLQAADILCWQVAKNIKDVAHANRDSRRDYVALVSKRTTIFYNWLKKDRILTIIDNMPGAVNGRRVAIIKDLFNNGQVSEESIKAWEALPKEALILGKGPLYWNQENKTPEVLRFLR